MKNKALSLFVLYTALYIVTFFIFNSFNLNGMTDDTYYLSSIYNFWNLSSLQLAIDAGKYSNFLANHFDPMLIFLSPLAYFFPEPLDLLKAINYIFIISWVTIAAYIFFENKAFTRELIYKYISFFILFFTSITILFNTFVNFNGLHSVLFAMPFLTLSYYFLIVKYEHQKAIFSFLPTLLIKEEFWLIFIFFNLAVFVVSKEKKYILFSIVSVFLFYLLYFKFMPFLNGGGENSHGGLYSHIFKATSLQEVFVNIISLPNIGTRIILILSFFIPFVVISKIRDIKKEDFLIALILIAPTVGYCFLSGNSVMSYFLFEHYSMVIIPILFAIIIKYPDLKKKNIFLYVGINIFFIIGILSFKEPWQYSYYKDEEQLINKVMPLVKKDIEYTDYISADDKTGVYFSEYQVDYLVNTDRNREKTPKYIIVNTRYVYLVNQKRSSLGTYEYLMGFNSIKDYELIYSRYPFLLFKYKLNISIDLDKEILNSWDLKAKESNRWF